MRIRTKMWIATVVVFLSGIVVGFYAGQMYLHWRVEKTIRRGPAALQEYMLKRMTLYLHPTADQVQPLQEVLRRVARQVEQRREKGMAEQWTMTKQELEQMQPSLTPPQRQVLERMKLADLLPGPRARIQRSAEPEQP